MVKEVSMAVVVEVKEAVVVLVAARHLQRERRRPSARRLLALQVRDRPGYL